MADMTGTIAYSDGDIDTNSSANPTLQELVNQRYSRRSMLMGGVNAASVAVFGSLVAACGDDKDSPSQGAPSLSAGSSGTTSSGKLVTLTSSSPGTIAQVSGPAVTLTTTATSATFIAPSVVAATSFVFRVNQNGNGAAADTTVTVQPAKLDFTAVPKGLGDVVTVPAGYSVTVLYRLGDPITAATPAFANNGTDTTYSQRAGDHHDGMSYFGLAATGTAADPTNSSRGLLVLNHENINQAYLHPAGATTVAARAPRARRSRRWSATASRSSRSRADRAPGPTSRARPSTAASLR